ncbi:hypothetical protein AB0G73_10775 [Streptomyces sp. NPDC020719]|uniref:hypothetical protein n=1 Tax=Streptomyces sp. NPDC020719 TaxID=3154896 RepID=UPI0033F72958
MSNDSKVRTWAIPAVALLLAAGLGRATAGEHRPVERTTPKSSIRIELPPCTDEDSNNCVWKADQRGNGIGRSYVVDPQGIPIYLNGEN